MSACPSDQPGQSSTDDSAEFAAFYASHRIVIFAFLLRIGARPSDAEDIAQEAMIRTWRAHGSLASPDHVRNYAYTCARRLYVDLQRLAESRAVRLGYYDHIVEDPGGDLPAVAAVKGEERQALLAALRELPPADLALLLDAEVHEIPTQELMARYELSPGALRARRFRTRQALRARLDHLRAPVLLLPAQRKSSRNWWVTRWLEDHGPSVASLAHTAVVLITAVSLVAGPFGGPLAPLPPAYAEAEAQPHTTASRLDEPPLIAPTAGTQRETDERPQPALALAVPEPTAAPTLFPTPSPTACVPGVGCAGAGETPPPPGLKDTAYVLVPGGLVGDSDRYLYVVPDAVEACDYWPETPVTGCTEGTPTPSPSPSGAR